MKYKPWKHVILITKHKWVVFKLCARCGLFWRGLVHDLSKYSWTEFSESVYYYKGTESPIHGAKKDQGYSKAWLHHKGRNKHHAEYWYDKDAPNPTPIIPYPYAAEMVCDNLAAGIIYSGKNWTRDRQLQYWNHIKDNIPLNEDIKKFLEHIYKQVSQEGIKTVITKKNLQQVYAQYVEKKK